MIKKELLVWHSLGGKISPTDIVSIYETDFDNSPIFQSYIQTCKLSDVDIARLKNKNLVTKLSCDYSHSVNNILRVKKALEEGNNVYASVILKCMFM